MKCLKQWSVILGALLINSLFFPSFSNAQSTSGFPSLNNLKERNAALEMHGFRFTSGIDKQGKANGKGLGIVQSAWDGSGFIVGTDGTIVTNYHVAWRALSGIARFDDGSFYEIKHIKVYDPYNDIAILKIKSTKSFPKVILGDSDSLQPLDKVLAVGNPEGMGINMAEGAVSQVVKDDNDHVAVIRHTATIAPGNSGGALYRKDEVVGVNVSINMSEYGGSAGFYNAIPINKVKRLLDNPKYNRSLPLRDVFSPDDKTVISKYHQLWSRAARVPAASSKDDPGAYSFNYQFGKLQDYVIIVFSPGRNLALFVIAKHKIIGSGYGQEAEKNGIYISSMYPENVTIGVLNYGSEPANFGIKVGKIIW